MDKIKCPNCSHEFDVEEALSGKLEAHFKAEYERKVSEQADIFNAKQDVLAKKMEAFELKKDQVLRAIAHEGPQVADIRFINTHDHREQVATAWSVALNSLEGIGGEKRLKKLRIKT